MPSDLVIVYLGLIGRSEPFRRLANEWATDATTDFDTLRADLDSHFPREILYPNSLADEVDQRRFVVALIAGERVQAIAMSGDSFDAPLGGADKGILVGNLHKTHEGVRAADGKLRSLITLPVRQVDPNGYSQREASRIFRRFVETIAADCLWLSMERQRTALQGMLDKAVKVDQSTIEETERLLRDRLPTILAELKLPTEYHTQKALREYQAEESRLHHLSAPAHKMEELKAELWRKVSDGALAAELLSAVRSKIRDFGYSAESGSLRAFPECRRCLPAARRNCDGRPFPCRAAFGRLRRISRHPLGPALSITWDATPKRGVVSVTTVTCLICS